MMRHIAIGILAAILAAGAQKTDEAERLLKAASNKELVDGDLNAAIKQYGAVAAKYANANRAVAAAALVRMADCYRKMGDAESRKIYERVLRDYPEQKEATAAARANLGQAQPGARTTNTLVWSGPKVDMEGTISPDGRYLSFTDWDTGDLAVHEIATGQERRLTDTRNTKDGNWKVFAEESAISRDGKHVAYSWYNEDNSKSYELWVANLTGNPNPQRLHQDPSVDWLMPCDWSPDGKSVAVVAEDKALASRLGLVSVETGSFRTLKTASSMDGFSYRIFFSPDGRYLAYDLPQEKNKTERDVFVMALEENREIPAVTHRANDTIIGWSPDGARLLFASDRNGSMALWSVAFDGGKTKGVPELIKADLGNIYPLGISRSGALYYGVKSGFPKSRLQTASIDFNTGKLLSPPRDLTPNYLESYSDPCWSPDGKYLAYTSSRDRRWPLHLVIRSAETGQVTQEFQPNLYFRPIGWAPDGRALLVRGRSGEGRIGTFRIDAQTGSVSAVFLQPAEGISLLQGVTSPDGKFFYHFRKVADGKEDALFKIDVTSGVEKELVRSPKLGGVNLSPDGQYIATFSVEPSTNSRLFILIPTGGGESRVVMRMASGVDPAQLRTPATGTGLGGVIWAPDSRSFLTFRWRSPEDYKNREVWRVPVDGAANKLEGPWDERILPGGRMHPDGKQLVYAATDQPVKLTREVWVLENFLPGPKAAAK